MGGAVRRRMGRTYPGWAAVVTALARFAGLGVEEYQASTALELWPGTVNETLSHAGPLTRSVADARASSS